LKTHHRVDEAGIFPDYQHVLVADQKTRLKRTKQHTAEGNPAVFLVNLHGFASVFS